MVGFIGLTVVINVAAVPVMIALGRLIVYYRRLTLTLGDNGVRLRRGASEETLAYRDVEAVERVNVQKGGTAMAMIRLRPRQEFFDRQGKRRPIFLDYRWTIPGGAFEVAQIDEFVPLLQQRVSQARALDSRWANALPLAGGTSVPTWTGSPERGQQIVRTLLYAMLAVIYLMQVDRFTQIYRISGNRIWVFVAGMLAVALVIYLPFAVRFILSCRALTLAVDDAGISLQQGRTTRFIAFTDIAAITALTALPAFTSAIIWPRADFLAKHGMKPSQKPSRLWMIRGFSDNQLRQALPLLQQGVERAGGTFHTASQSDTVRRPES